MTYTVNSWVSGEILTSSDMNALKENFAAIAAQDAGAPQVKLSALNAQIHSYQINTGTLAYGESMVLPPGYHVLMNDAEAEYSYAYVSSLNMQIYINSDWRPTGHGVLSNGVNMRLLNSIYMTTTSYALLSYY